MGSVHGPEEKFLLTKKKVLGDIFNLIGVTFATTDTPAPPA
jgi:hypothetical protein